MINWIEKFKCRCSGISKMMSTSRSNPCLTEKQGIRLLELETKGKITDNQKLELADLLVKQDNSKKIILSDTCVEYLMEVFAWETYKKKPLKEMFEIQQMQKGKLAEQESIALLSVVEGEMHVKNTERIYNEFLSGEPDVFVGEEIMKATKVTDIKSCYDYPSFLKKINIEPANGWADQLRGYGNITGSIDLEIAHTLVNMPEMMRSDMKRKMFYDGEYVTEESPDFLKKWNEAEHSMIFDEIPIQQRLFKIKVAPFTEFEIVQIYDKVKVCRDWLWEFSEKYQKLNT